MEVDPGNSNNLVFTFRSRSIANQVIINKCNVVYYIINNMQQLMLYIAKGTE